MEVIRGWLAVDDRTFTVLGEPWYDPPSGEWKGRFLYVPLDRSLPQTVGTHAVRHARQRDEVVRQLSAASDRELAQAFRAIPLSPIVPPAVPGER
ncbi:MAG TPA: hypothetical protein VFW98_12115 [Gemmatimonadaceae bacterium]|nr:hypothetical protein [Gemmatimonadaceae bacterium]